MTRLYPALLAALLLTPACDRGDKELTPEEAAAKLASDLEEAAARLRNNKLKDAETIYARILKEDPENGDALGGMGKVRLEEKNYADAEILLAQATAKKPEDAKLYSALGQARQMDKKPAEAAEAYAKAFEIESDNSSYGLSYGRELKKAGKFDEAEQVLRKVAELDPKAQFVFTELGDSLREQNKLDEALRTYMKAQNTYRSDKMAHAGAAFVYEAQGDNGHALDEWSSYIRMDCCSDFSKTVAQKKIESLKVAHGDGETPEDAAG